MFTGLIETTGTLRRRERRGPGYRMRLETDLGRDGEALTLGESVAVSGACLTVVSFDDRGFEVDVSRETVEKTTLGQVAAGGRLNLERSLRLADRLGGHLVSGHVDGLARVREVAIVGEAWCVRVEAPAELLPYIAAKGSVALDGVSLTVNDVSNPVFEVMIIPHTRAVTTLEELRAGSVLNLEVDLLARYVVRYVQATNPDRGGGLGVALERAGFK